MEPANYDEDFKKRLAESFAYKEGTMTTAEIISEIQSSEKKSPEPKKKREPDPVLISSADEAMFQFDFATQLFYRLVDGTTNPEFIEQAKKMIGEDRVKEVMKQVEQTPPEQKKAIMDYAKSFK